MLVGFHGKRNLGDDLFLAILANWLGRDLQVDEVTVSAVGEQLPRVGTSPLLKGYWPARRLLPREDKLRLFVAALNADMLIFGAGSIFTIDAFRWLHATVKALRRLRGRSLKLAAIGVSIGPFRSESDREFCFKTLALFDVILVRDGISAELLAGRAEAPRVIPSLDLALSAAHWFPRAFEENAHPPRSAKVLGVVLNDYDFLFNRGDRTRDVERGRRIAAVLRQVRDGVPGLQIRLLEACGDGLYGDAPFNQRLMQELGPDGVEVIPYNNDPVGYLRFVAGCDVVLASRMHGGLLAKLCGIPVVQLSYAQKIDELYRALDFSRDYLHSYDGFDAAELGRQLIRLLLDPAHAQAADFAALKVGCGRVTNDLAAAAAHLNRGELSGEPSHANG